MGATQQELHAVADRKMSVFFVFLVALAQSIET